MITEERRAEFHQQVADHKLKVDGSRGDRPVRILGILLMIGGVIGAAMYGATAVSKVRRLWLLRQLVESQSQADQIATALRERA